MFRNKLQPTGMGRWLINFLASFFWAIVWLGRSIIKFCQRR